MHQWDADRYGKASAFATMDQYKTLWDGEYSGGLPLIFNFMNNLYGMGGQTWVRPWVMVFLPGSVPV